MRQVPAVTELPLSLDDLDRTIAAFDTVEQLLRSLSPDTWRQDLDSIYTQTHLHYRSRAYHLASRHNKGKSCIRPTGSKKPQMYSCIQMYSLSFGSNISAAGGKGWHITKQLHGRRRLGIKMMSVEGIDCLLEAIKL